MRSEIEVRTQGDPRGVAAAIRKLVAQVDPNLPITHVQSLSAQIGENYDRERLAARFVGFFSGLALLLACVGLYGVVARMLPVAEPRSACVWRWELSVRGFFGWSFVIRLYCYAGA